MSKRHHIVFGRRGSGKTSMLRKAMSELSTAGRPVAFVDLETFKEHSYPDVLLSILIAVLVEFEKWFNRNAEGVALLGRIVTASLFVMNLQGGLGVAMVRTFLTLAGLHTLVASSESSLRRARSALIAATVAWGDSQDRALAAQMTKKPVVICADENFDEGLMLVAIEPVSNFILLEQRDKHRDAKTWSCALQHSLSLWPVELCAMIGDEAKGLILCATQMLGIVKGSDLFPSTTPCAGARPGR